MLAAAGINFTPTQASAAAGGWTARASGTVSNLNAVMWTGSQFVAVGSAGIILTSPDGLEWAGQSSPTNNDLLGIASFQNQLIAVGNIGTLVTSKDGVRWLSQNTNIQERLVGVAANASLVVATGDDGVILHSADGLDWGNKLDQQFDEFGHTFVQKTRPSGTHAPLHYLIWSGHLFVAPGNQILMTSTDGQKWVQAANVARRQLVSVVFNGTLFLALGEKGTVLASFDALAWQPLFAVTDEKLNAGLWTGNYFVIVGTAGTIVTSADGVVWSETASHTPDSLNGIASNGTLLVAVGGHGTILTAPPPLKLAHAGTLAPVMGDSPANLTVLTGHGATYLLMVAGNPEPSYQWQYKKAKDVTWTNLSDGPLCTGATNASLTIAKPVPAMSGDQFRCVVKNSAGTVTSSVASLTVKAPTPPVISAQSPDVAVTVRGGTSRRAIFSVSAAGDPPPAYQWQQRASEDAPWSNVKDDNIGASGQTLILETNLSMNGEQFQCLVTNEAGSVTSNTTTLTVSEPPAPLGQ